MPKGRGPYTEWQQKVEATQKRVKTTLVIETVNLERLFDAMEESCRGMGTALNGLQPGDRAEGLRYTVGDLVRSLNNMRTSAGIIAHRAEELGGGDE
jgi:hypothetical protein